MSKPPQPTIYDVVMSERSLDLALLLDRTLTGPAFIEFRDTIKRRTTDAIRAAYTRGVADGFAQGAAAAEAQSD
jgi:hypothetical protein